MTTDPQRPTRFALPISEVLIVVAILSTLAALTLPAVNAARESTSHGVRDARPPLLPQLKPFYERSPWPFLIGTPIVVTAGVAALFGILRYLLPESSRKYFPWCAPPRPPVQLSEPIADSRPAIATMAMASCATAILVFAASHVRADRTHRRPIVTWEGPLAEYVQHAAILGWLLSAAAIGLGAYSLCRFRSRLSYLGTIGMCLGLLNYFGSCLFWGAVYED
jgi:hypothetical protein